MSSRLLRFGSCLNFSVRKFFQMSNRGAMGMRVITLVSTLEVRVSPSSSADLASIMILLMRSVGSSSVNFFHFLKVHVAHNNWVLFE